MRAINVYVNMKIRKKDRIFVCTNNTEEKKLSLL